MSSSLVSLLKLALPSCCTLQPSQTLHQNCEKFSDLHVMGCSGRRNAPKLGLAKGSGFWGFLHILDTKTMHCSSVAAVRQNKTNPPATSVQLANNMAVLTPVITGMQPSQHTVTCSLHTPDPYPCAVATGCLDKDCHCRNFKLGAVKCLDIACCHLPVGCNCLDKQGNCCPGGFQSRCQQMSLRCGKCLTCGTLGCKLSCACSC